MKNVYYTIEVQMSGTNVITKEVLGCIENYLGVAGTDVDEREPHYVAFFAKLNVMPSEMRERVWKLLNNVRSSKDHEPMIHYVDVIYRWETEMNADRFVFWSNGYSQEYTGTMIFKEDK